MKNKNIQSQNYNAIESEEIKILSAQIEIKNQEIALHNSLIQKLEQEKSESLEAQKAIYEKLSQRYGYSINETNLKDIPATEEEICELIDEVNGTRHKLIRLAHSILPYSLLKQKPELQEFVPEDFKSPLDALRDKSTSRAFEILREETAQETHRAHTGDLIYIQAWLSAIGFSFKTPISEKEILSFMIQHCEGLDEEIDKKLVEQRYKNKLGSHQLATIKRRIASLSVFLELENLPNPCRNREVSMLFNKLTKKYGRSKPAGKAITRDILDDILDTCDNSLIGIRNKAVLLFAFASGGRRRKEVASALFKDLIKHPDGDYTYTIPQSKTDQSGQGYVVPVKGRAAKALSDWLTKANICDGNIFRSISKSGLISENPLSPVDINRAVKKHIKLAGYDEKEFGAHSLRAGFVTEAGRKQKPIGDVMQMTTHRSIATVMKYYQAGDISNNSAANLAD